MKSFPLDTPSLLMDLDVMERNLAAMAAFFAAGSTRLRPHYKNHKCVSLARKQIAAGAVGITCATLSEAEALAHQGVRAEILIANEIAGERKIGRFVELARSSEVIAVVDHPAVVDAMAAAGRNKGVRLPVLINLNVGQNRCGVLSPKVCIFAELWVTRDMRDIWRQGPRRSASRQTLCAV